MKPGIQLLTLSHHAYYLVGSDSLVDELKNILDKQHKISSQANPDFFEKKCEVFTIDDARELKAQHNMRPVHASTKKIFILTMGGITVEAQNALLKLLEEPADYAHFFLILPSAHLLLPTIKSRITFLETSSTKKEKSDEGKKFLKLSAAKRLDVIKTLLDDVSKEKKSRQDAVNFLNDIEQAVYLEQGVQKGREVLKKIQTVRTYIDDRSPSLKMLLEYVALNA